MPTLTTQPPPTATTPTAAVRVASPPRAVQLAAGTTVQMRRDGSLTDPMTLPQAARHRRIALASLEAVWEALWQLAVPTAGVLSRVPAAVVAQIADKSIAQVNRSIPLLRAFGLIRRRGRRRGAWDTTIPALVAHAAADNDALDALWQAATAPTRDRVIPRSAARIAAAAGDVDHAAHITPEPLACAAVPLCDLAAVTELVVLAVGPQARNQSWQGDLAAALRAGWSPRALATELTRNLDTARVVPSVCRDRLMVVIGRVPQAHRHCCGEWVEPQPPPGHGDPHPVPWHSHPPRRSPAEPERPPADVGPVEEPPASVVMAQIAHNHANTRTTSRKDSHRTSLSPPNPPTTGGETQQQPPPAASEAAETLSNAILTEATELRCVRLRRDDRVEAVATLARQLDDADADLDSLDLRLDTLLGLIAGTSTVDRPAKILMWRVRNPTDRARIAARYRPAVDRLGAAGLSEPAAAAVASAHARRVAARVAVQALHDREREAAQLAELEQQQARAARQAAVDADRRRQDRQQAARRLCDAAEGLLGRALNPAVPPIAERIVLAPPPAAGAALRRHARDAVLAADLAALAAAAGFAADLIALPVLILPQGALRRALSAHAAHRGDLLRAVCAGEPPPAAADPAIAAALDPADIDAALTAAAASDALDTDQRRAWGEWLIAARIMRRTRR